MLQLNNLFGYQNTSSYYYSVGVSVVVDSNDGSVYILGYRSDVITFKLSPNKDILWSIIYGTTDSDYAGDMAQNNEGYLFVTGYTTSGYSKFSFLYKISSFQNYEYELTKYDANSGEKYWTIDLLTASPDYYEQSPVSISVNSNENIRLTGTVYDNNVYHQSYGSCYDYFILSPQICQSGYYNTNYLNSCQPCPVVHYSSPEASSKCKSVKEDMIQIQENQNAINVMEDIITTTILNVFTLQVNFYFT